MAPSSKMQLLDTIMERACDILGDVTPHVFNLYYVTFPEARAHFVKHARSKCGQLEGQMVEQILYCLMEWPESPEQVKIILLDCGPHHVETLDIPPGLFCGLIDAVCNVIDKTIPQQEEDEKALWKSIHNDVRAVCLDQLETVGKGSFRRDGSRPRMTMELKEVGLDVGERRVG